MLEKNLKKLCLSVGVSEYEEKSGITSCLLDLIKNINKNTKTDEKGNIFSVIGKSGKTYILEAHMDEVGFIAKKRKNTIFLLPKGIVKDEKILNCEAFVVDKNIKGKIVKSKKDFIFEPKNKKYFEKISENDIISFQRSFSTSKNRLIKASALDNRIGCAVLLDVMKKISFTRPKNKIIFVFSTKEETGKSSFNSIVKKYGNKSTAIIVDAAYAQPIKFECNDKDINIPKIGKGCAIQTKGKGVKILKSSIKNIKDIADLNNIYTQEERTPKNMGKTNLSKMFEAGIKNGFIINIPVRNQHCQTAKTSIFDAEQASRLIFLLLNQ